MSFLNQKGGRVQPLGAINRPLGVSTKKVPIKQFGGGSDFNDLVELSELLSLDTELVTDGECNCAKELSVFREIARVYKDMGGDPNNLTVEGNFSTSDKVKIKRYLELYTKHRL